MSKPSVSTFSLITMCVGNLASNRSTHTMYNGNKCTECCQRYKHIYTPFRIPPFVEMVREPPSSYKVPNTIVCIKKCVNHRFYTRFCIPHRLCKMLENHLFCTIQRFVYHRKIFFEPIVRYKRYRCPLDMFIPTSYNHA